MTSLRISCLQLAPRAAESSGDSYLDTVCEQIKDAGDADLIVLPELWHVGYFAFDRYEREATSLDDPLPRRLAALASELDVTLHAGSLVESGSGLRNTSVVFGPDGTEIASYSKVHVFGYGSRERELVTGGWRLATFPLSTAHVGMAICYDLRFPELFRAVADDVVMYVVPATWPAARLDAWATLLRARAIENQAFVVGCNAAGTSHGVQLGGHSAVVDPWGEVVGELDATPGSLNVVIDLGAANRAREEFPALRDRVWKAPPRIVEAMEGER